MPASNFMVLSPSTLDSVGIGQWLIPTQCEMVCWAHIGKALNLES